MCDLLLLLLLLILFSALIIAMILFNVLDVFVKQNGPGRCAFIVRRQVFGGVFKAKIQKQRPLVQRNVGMGRGL